MAWSLVQRTAIEGTTTSPQALAFASNVAAGSLKVARVSIYNGGGQVESVSDSVDGAYTLASTSVQGTTTVQIFYLKNATAGATTVTATGSVGTVFSVSLDIAEFSGIDTTAPLDTTTTGGGAAGSTAPSAGSLASGSGNLVLGVCSHDGGSTGTWSAGAGYTIGASIPGFSGRALATEYGTATGAAQAVDFTLSAAGGNWAAAAASFKLAGAGAATTYTLGASPNPVTAGSTTTATVTPNGTFTGTVVVTPTGSASTGLSAHTFTFSGTSAPQTFGFTPTVTGTLTLTGTHTGTLTGGDPAAVNVTVNAAPNAVAITAPVQYQSYQRHGTSSAVALSGTHAGATSIEASTDGGSTWAVVANGSGTGTLGGSTWSGSLTLATGQYTLSVRLGNDHATTASVTFVTVTDCFVLAGQSNMESGAGTIFPSTPYISTMPRATKLSDSTGAGVWAQGVDPIHSAAIAGSEWPGVSYFLWPLIGTMPSWGPNAISGTSITQWQPGGTDYNAMKARAQAMAPSSPYAKVLLWWQGESDAQAGMSQATYFADYQAFAAGVAADLGCKVMPCKLHDISVNVGSGPWAAINAAIAQAWASDPNTIQGPDLSALVADAGGLHLTSDANIQAAGALWMRAIDRAFYAPAGGGPTYSRGRIVNG